MTAAFQVWCVEMGELAFVEPTGNGDIQLVREDGSNVRQLTNDPAVEADPAWSPDGTQLAFTSDRDGHPEIHVMNADGSGTPRLTYDDGRDPAWSPDRVHMVVSTTLCIDDFYTHAPFGCYPAVAVMGAGGPSFAGDRGSWSPDGRKRSSPAWRPR